MPEVRFRIVQVPRWQIVLATAVVLATLAALFVVAFGIFLLVLPVFLVIGALAYLFGGGPPAKSHADRDVRTIDADYRVIEEKRIERNRDR